MPVSRQQSESSEMEPDASPGGRLGDLSRGGSLESGSSGSRSRSVTLVSDRWLRRGGWLILCRPPASRRHVSGHPLGFASSASPHPCSVRWHLIRHRRRVCTDAEPCSAARRISQWWPVTRPPRGPCPEGRRTPAGACCRSARGGLKGEKASRGKANSLRSGFLPLCKYKCFCIHLS